MAKLHQDKNDNEPERSADKKARLDKQPSLGFGMAFENQMTNCGCHH